MSGGCPWLTCPSPKRLAAPLRFGGILAAQRNLRRLLQCRDDVSTLSATMKIDVSDETMKPSSRICSNSAAAGSSSRRYWRSDRLAVMAELRQVICFNQLSSVPTTPRQRYKGVRRARTSAFCVHAARRTINQSCTPASGLHALASWEVRSLSRVRRHRAPLCDFAHQSDAGAA